MLFLDGVYVDGPHGLRFRWVKAPTSSELTQLAQAIAHRTARFLERQGLLERDAEQVYFTAADPVAERRLSLTAHGQVSYHLKTPYRDGTTHVIFEPLDFIAKLRTLSMEE